MYLRMCLCLDFYLGFVNRSYSVNDKNIPEVPVIKFLRSPFKYPPGMFPINVTVIEDDVTATGKCYINTVHVCMLILYEAKNYKD